MKKKGIVKLIIVLSVVTVIGVIVFSGCMHLSREHDEARNVLIAAIDFSNLQDGIYTGEYEGGMYKWRVNKVRVTVDSGRVTGIDLLNSSDPGEENTDSRQLYDLIIQAQSLQIDVISGATLTSKAYLKGVEIALSQARLD